MKNLFNFKHFKGDLFGGIIAGIVALPIIIRMGRMQYIDQSGLYAMEDILVDLVRDGKKVLFVNIIEQPRYMLERIDIIPDLIPKEHVFDTFDDCLKWIKENK